MKPSSTVRLLFLAVLATSAAPSAVADYPARPVRMVVPYPPGGPLDTLARIFTDKLGPAMGQPFVVENRPGANGNIGGELVARAAPDGHLLLWAIDTAITVNPALYAKMPFDPLKDLAPVTLVSTSDSVLVVNAATPASSVRDVVQLAKSKSLNFSSGGNGSPAHLATELFMRETGVRMTHVPYKGNAPAVASLLAGETHLSIASIPGVMAHIKSGRLKALAVTGSKRTSFLAELPTFKEAGYPGVVVDGWRAIFAPAGTPRAVIDSLNRELARIAKLADVQERLGAIGTVAVISTPEQLAEVAGSDARKWARVVKEANVALQ